MPSTLGDMGLDDLLTKSAGGDLRRVVDLVDQLWEDRNKITEVVGLVWDNRDELTRALTFVQDHGDDLVDLLKQLPDLLATAGEALDAAGAGATTASVFLLGDQTGTSKNANKLSGRGSATVAVSTLTGTAADALERCQEELHGVESMLSGIGRQVEALGIFPKSLTDLGGGAQRVSAVADDLATVALQLRQLGVSVNDAGTDLGTVGEKLQQSGSTLQSLAGGPKKTRSTKARSKKARVAKAKK